MFGSSGTSGGPSNSFLSTYGQNNQMYGDTLLNEGQSELSNGPVTSVPSGMILPVSLSGAVSQSNKAETKLPTFLQMTTKNPIFSTPSQNIAETYGNNLYNYEMSPQLGADAEQSWLNGNIGNSGSSTFGADYMANQNASAAQQSFLGGQSYYDDLLNNTLNERNNFFSNDVADALNADEANQQAQLQGLNMLNSYQLGAANDYGNLAGLTNQFAGTAYNEDNFNRQLALQQQEAEGILGTGLGVGLSGLTGGLANKFLGSGGSGGGSSPASVTGGGGGSGFASGPFMLGGTLYPQTSVGDFSPTMTQAPYASDTSFMNTGYV